MELKWAPLGANEAHMDSSRASVEPKWSSREPRWSPNEPKWIQMELERGIKPYAVPSKVNCSIRLIAHGPYVHFDTVLENKPQVGVGSGITCAHHRSNRAAGCFLRSITFYSRKTVFSIVGQRRSRVQSTTCQRKK